ncbi:hypothetical protein HLI_16675 [Halobacillus litoralis]|uniref:Uncharacterized protein n=1 Tax=Halobacillus litoralis TaxID=45668 RepID=A0A410MG94_9BACI|nr:hypothetical protein HLI_16675 [Halobacillus litoralis]
MVYPPKKRHVHPLVISKYTYRKGRWGRGRLPWEKGLGEIPQGVSPRKLARSPAGKRALPQRP